MSTNREGDMTEHTIYYAMVMGEKYPRERPAGVIRRRRVYGVDYDESFTRNLKWEPTEYLERHFMRGSSGEPPVEITEEEADSFVLRIKTLGPNEGQR